MASVQAHTAEGRNEKPYSREEFTAWLTRSCERQQLAVTITNPVVLADIATLLR
ncbi:hypothetical protein [Mycobacterium avium]|uniref:hypothetical protein n=1 Tax=Mycobacterium avium TaxID=1764 RepID=UPI0003D1ECE8|nr:hypothetical protein [Mycobacterium avium]ETA90102.1 hypothetical protein O984_23870 [Mycobacterium avium 05-4293]